jgi:hypothetical protein
VCKPSETTGNNGFVGQRTSILAKFLGAICRSSCQRFVRSEYASGCIEALMKARRAILHQVRARTNFDTRSFKPRCVLKHVLVVLGIPTRMVYEIERDMICT